MKRDIFINNSSGRISAKFYDASVELDNIVKCGTSQGNIEIDAKKELYSRTGVLLLPPDRRLGGSMKNKVMKTLFNVFQDKGFSVLGIEYSQEDNTPYVQNEAQHVTTGELSEMTDASYAIDWLYSAKNIDRIWIVGFSFGAWIALQLVTRRPEVLSFIALSLPAKKYDFSFVSPCPVPGLVLHGEEDEAILPSYVNEVVEFLESQKISNFIKDSSLPSQFIHYNTIQNANHLMNSAENQEDIYREVSNYIDLFYEQKESKSKEDDIIKQDIEEDTVTLIEQNIYNDDSDSEEEIEDISLEEESYETTE